MSIYSSYIVVTASFVASGAVNATNNPIVARQQAQEKIYTL
jgi:hypothetical protein